MAKAMPSAADVAARWQSGFGNSGNKWEAGINAVDVAPGILAAAASDRYLMGVQNGVDKLRANVAKKTLGEWKADAVRKGKGRLPSRPSARPPKYPAKIAPVLATIRDLRD